MGHELTVEETVEPDAIRWQNLQYSIFDQNVRRCQTSLVVALFLAGATIFTLYMNGAKALIEQVI